MSLKAFHIFFIIVATLFCGFFGYWTSQEYMRVGGGENLGLTILTAAFGAALVFYFFWFLTKLRREKALQS